MGLISLLHKIYEFKVKKYNTIKHVAGMGEMRNHYRILIGKPERRRVLGRPKRR
jgi:hypothetical protein